MDMSKLLKEWSCSCGKTHSCPVREVVIEEGALRKLPSLARDYHKILLVADKNTDAAAGRDAAEILGEKLERRLVYQTDELLIPNEEAVAEMEAALTEETDLILGVGSGVIQDLCKYVSFRKGLPYFIAATAPSMDGYASVGAAMIMGNMKVSYPSRVPEVIIGDVDVLKNAPMDMIQSGYGDILGKFSSLNDWKLSELVNGEYLCPEVYALTCEMLDQTKGLGPKLLAREPEAVKTLMEALVGVGIAMAYVGNSRPASGSEHHLSHFFEIVGILNREPYFLHGIDVAYSAVWVQMLREKLLALDTLPEAAPFDRQEWIAEIRRVYSAAADGVIALQDEMGRYEKDWLAVYREKWPQIREVLSKTPSSDEMIRYLDSAGLKMDEFEKQYGRKKLDDAVRYAKDLKDRYTMLWLYDTVFHYGKR